MKKSLLLLINLFLFENQVFSQNPTPEERFGGWQLQKIAQSKGPCDVYMFKSNTAAEKVVDNILKSAGMGFGKRNFQVVECPNVENCYATIIGGIRYIVYDQSFLKLVEDRTNTDWASVSIMAHEIGHHVLGHTGDGTGSRPDKEIAADYFSGFVVHNLGGTLDEAQVAIRILQKEEGDFTHPPRKERLAAIEKGWNEAEEFYPKFAGKTVKKEVPVETEQAKEIPKTRATTGCVSGNCEEGEGTYVNRKTLEKYEGEWAKARPHGFGTQSYSDGKKKYEGEFADGRFEGNGTLWYPNGNIYSGNFYQGNADGKGILFYGNGDRYVGTFKQGKRHGTGKYIYANGRQEVIYYVKDARQETE